MLVEKCRFIGASPKEVLELPEVESDFLSIAIGKAFKDGRGVGQW